MNTGIGEFEHIYEWEPWKLIPSGLYEDVLQIRWHGTDGLRGIHLQGRDIFAWVRVKAKVVNVEIRTCRYYIQKHTMIIENVSIFKVT